jgi:outer membrane protein
MIKETGAVTIESVSPLGRRERMFLFVMALGSLLLGTTEPLSAETLLSALARAYAGNPDLNQSRAAVRVRDEDMPKALAGMRPKANIQASAGPLYGNLRLPAGRNATTGQRQFTQGEYTGYPRGATPNISQSIFEAGRTSNSVRQAESNVFAARATMRLNEQATLQNGATTYMNVARDTAVVNLRKNYIAVLEQQLKQTRDRFQVGEVTRTDVAQA